MLAGVLLGIGLPITLLGVIQGFDSKAAAHDREGALAALMLFGLPPTVAGGWLLCQGHDRDQQEMRDRLRSTFFRLLNEGGGHVTVLRFAMETGLDGATAKTYLEERAKEFNASYDVAEEGSITYYFNLGGRNLPGATSGVISGTTETYDVILEFVPSNRQRQVVKVVREIIGSDWKEAKALVKQLPEPVVIRRGLSRQLAEEYRDRLKSAGADVLVILA